jgi:putative RNA 2'-phosphotransferase
MTQDFINASKFLSFVLRHGPKAIGLALDRQGWASIEELIGKARPHGMALARELIAEVVATSDKQRFAIDETGQRIRANQGHSVGVDLGLEPANPPSVLFHGTAEATVPAIRAEGLKSGQRQHVHLSPDEQTAIRGPAWQAGGAAHSSGAPASAGIRVFSLDERGVADRLCAQPVHPIPERDNLRRKKCAPPS